MIRTAWNLEICLRNGLHLPLTNCPALRQATQMMAPFLSPFTPSLFFIVCLPCCITNKKTLRVRPTQRVAPSFLNPSNEDYTSESEWTHSRMFRQVFWLSDKPTFRTFPFRWFTKQWYLQISSPITAAGPLPTCTGFPIKLLKHLIYIIVLLFHSVNEKRKDDHMWRCRGFT